MKVRSSAKLFRLENIRFQMNVFFKHDHSGWFAMGSWNYDFFHFEVFIKLGDFSLLRRPSSFLDTAEQSSSEERKKKQTAKRDNNHNYNS